MADNLTLVDIERKLRKLVNDLASVQKQLATARDEEVSAKHEYEARQRRLLLSPDCPRPGTVQDGGKVTVAERDAWVAQGAEAEQFAYDTAVAAREAAQEHLRTLKDQSMLVMALSRSVQLSMGLAGHGDGGP